MKRARARLFDGPAYIVLVLALAALVVIVTIFAAKKARAQEKAPTHAEVYAGEVKAARDRCEADLKAKLTKAYGEIERLKAELAKPKEDAKK